MASASEDDAGGGIRFVQERDGSITAIDDETGLAAGGDSRSDALANLAETLTLHEGGGEPIEDVDAWLVEHGIDPDELPDEPSSLPEFLR